MTIKIDNLEFEILVTKYEIDKHDMQSIVLEGIKLKMVK